MPKQTQMLLSHVETAENIHKGQVSKSSTAPIVSKISSERLKTVNGKISDSRNLDVLTQALDNCYCFLF